MLVKRLHLPIYRDSWDYVALYNEEIASFHSWNQTLGISTGIRQPWVHQQPKPIFRQLFEMEVVDAMPVCPFCPFSVASKDESDTYFLMQHLELCHPENGYSPFIADEDKATSADDTDGAETTNRSSFSDEDLSNSEDKSNVYMECPLQCGETVTIAELTNHLELHAAEGTALEEEDAKATTKGITPQLNNSGSDTTHQPHSSSSLRAPSSVKAKDAVEAKRNHSRQKNKQSPFWEGLGRILVPSPKKRRTGKAKYSAARRLGVCRPIPLLPFLIKAD